MPVRSRQVFYFHGFDPASTARYRRIFEAASARLSVAVADPPEDVDGWQATRGETLTEFRYLRYEDLVRDFQRGGLLSRIGRGILAVAGMAVEGAWRRLRLASLILALSPVVLAFTPLLVAAPLSGPAPTLALGVGAVLAAGALFLLLGMKVLLAADLFAYMRTLAEREGPHAAAYEARLPELAAEVETGADETLVVGHSLGGIAAIRTVAGLLDRLPGDAQVGLLTLGSVHGVVLAQRGPGREDLADAMARLASDPRIAWVDVSSPRDAFCVPLTDPLWLIGDRATPGMTSPRVISTRLARAPRIPGDRRTVFATMRRHMGYLLAPTEGSGFDYADWVTGEISLAERAAGRGNSPKARMWPG